MLGSSCFEPMTAYLERAALHQTRFRTPGIAPDARGVVLGQKGALLFPSLDRVVAFFRAQSEEGSLDEIVPSLSIHRVVTPLRTREMLVLMNADSSYRMDRVASLARLVGGMVFTGTSRHFVQYRDAASPLGYDVAELLDEPADLIVYAESFRQVYSFEREIPFRTLVLRLDLRRVAPVPDRIRPRLWATAEVGIGQALVGYLARWGVRAKVAFAQWPSESAFDDRPVRLHVFELEDAPPRIVRLMRSLPGVRVFEPRGSGVGVELGFEHPIALASCPSLFAEGLTLFGGGGEVRIVDPMPSWVPVRALVRSTVHFDRPGVLTGAPVADAGPAMHLELRLVPTSAPWRKVVATVVPVAQRAWLGKLLYVLPQRTLEALRIAMSENAFYLLDPAGIEGVPLGRFYTEIASRIYVPAGWTLAPAMAASVLEEFVGDPAGGHVFFELEASAPRLVPDAAFGPLSRRVLRDVAGALVDARAPDRSDPPLPTIQYGPDTRFPLWGAPGRARSEASQDEGGG